MCDEGIPLWVFDCTRRADEYSLDKCPHPFYVIAPDNKSFVLIFDRSNKSNGAEKRMVENELLKSLRRMNHKPPSGESTPFSSY